MVAKREEKEGLELSTDEIMKQIRKLKKSRGKKWDWE